MSNPLLSLQEFDQVFKQLFNSDRESCGFPLVKIKDDGDNLTIQFALAGYPRDALSIEVKGDVIKVRGDKVEDEGNLFASRAFTWERRDVQGQWALEKADVKYENGALTLSIPKKDEKKAKLLTIQ